MSALDVDEMIAHVLISEGFSTVDEIALVSVDELSSIEGFDEDLAQELQNRAKAFVEKDKTQILELGYIKKETSDKSRSFVFSKKTLQVFKDSNLYSIYFQVLLEID